MTRLLGLMIAAALALFAAGEASAHPHVWVTMKSELLYGADGKVTGVRHAWTFDEMFSTFATQGLESKTKGEFTREELASLAEVNVSSLKEYDFFTYAKANGSKTDFEQPTDYWLDYTNNVLTLHFTLPLKAPLQVQSLDLEVYDATYFVDFSFADKDPVSLVNAPGGCKVAVGRPFDNSKPPPQKGEAFFNNPSSNFGAQYANKISVKCP